MTIPIDESWTLTFDEEFNGTSLDTDVWNDSWFGAPGEPSPPVNDAEYGAYDPDQVAVYDGTLHLTLEEEPVTVDGVDYDYTGGIVTTNGNFEQAYGYFEARIYLPGVGGQIANWPGFWTNGQNWPEDGEIDIVEGLDGDASWHYHYPGGAPGDHAAGDYTGWHTYGMLWEPDKISFYYDNELVGEITTGVTDSPHYIILQNGLGEWGGPIMTPSEMQVDWVHVYSIDPDAVAVEPQDGYTGPGGTGGTGEEAITGTAGNDTLWGNSAANVLDGRGGADHMLGGAGNDTYVVDNVGDAVTEAAGAGVDRVESSISYTLAADIENLTLAGSAGTNGTGNDLNNTITGNSGINRIDGGIGADQMAGGHGNDIYVVDSAGDQVTEAAGGGTDTVESSVTYTLTPNVEKLTLAGNAGTNATGNDLANIIIGNSGINRIDGGAGADQMAGGNGNDTYVVDNRNDVITEEWGCGTDKVESSVSYTLAANVDNLTLTGSAGTNGTGNSLVNTITGNSGVNRIDGGIGADRMVGGPGNDTYIVDSAGDQVIEAAGEGVDTVQSSVSYTLPANVEKLTLTGSAGTNGTGNALANTVIGNSGINRIDGDRQNDTLTGGGSADTFVFDDGDGDDTVTDFQNGIDRLDLTAVAGIDEFSDLVLTDTGSGVHVDYGTGGVELASTNFNAINASDFIFA